ncbi:hypothetical protein [Paenibacillus sp. WLX2291]|uniref:hypothetical protein n=1 Tax=Paenibacillus sp. WLX2291 TaxID=3296934 RepID=UPI0039840E05
MLGEGLIWKTASKVVLAGSLFAAGFQPISVNAAVAVQTANTTSTAQAQKSVSVILDGKTLSGVKAFYKENKVWVPVLSFSKAAGMKIQYTYEDGLKKWEMSYKQHAITSQLNTFYLYVETDDVYLMTEGGSFFENLKVIKGIVYAPIDALSALAQYNTIYKKSNQALYVNTIGKSQDQSIRKLAFAYLKDYEHVNQMNLNLYHPNYLYWQYITKYPTFMSSIQPGESGNSKDSKVKVDGIQLNSLMYNNKATKAQLELKYTISNTALPVHYDVDSTVWLSKFHGNWTVEFIRDGYTTRINTDVLQKQQNIQQTQPQLVNKIKEDATQYYNAWTNKDAKLVTYWTNMSNQLHDDGKPYSEEQFQKEVNDLFAYSYVERELKEIEIINIDHDIALVMKTENNYDVAQFYEGEPIVQKKLSRFKMMEDGRWVFDSDIDYINEVTAGNSGYGPATTEQ